MANRSSKPLEREISVLHSSSSTAEFTPILGAEARIELVDWYGKEAIRKTRIQKMYRNKKLDQWLRSKRTREEAEILHRAKLLGVDCPVFYFADPHKNELIMEYVEGQLLRDLEAVSSRRKLQRDDKLLSGLFVLLGKYAARLHRGNLIHGDLTTKNMIVTNQDRLVLIDFGLSFLSARTEDKAEDLHLLKQALKSTVNEGQAKVLFERVMEGYSSEAGGNISSKIYSQIHEIEKRGRYARVD
jgi:Kae1-associated kinase Bud32